MRFAFLLLALMTLALVCCSNAKPDRCLEGPPVSKGLCLMAGIGFTYNADKNACEDWFGGGCTFEGNNRFPTMDECTKTCVD